MAQGEGKEKIFFSCTTKILVAVKRVLFMFQVGNSLELVGIIAVGLADSIHGGIVDLHVRMAERLAPLVFLL
jgi:hypothetical protein